MIPKHRYRIAWCIPLPLDRFTSLRMDVPRSVSNANLPQCRSRLHRGVLVTFGLLAATLVLASHNRVQAALVGYWNFNEGVATTANDTSGTGNTGSLNAGGQGMPTTWVTGHTGSPPDKALSFTGFSDRLVIPIFGSMNITNSFTFSLWAKADFFNFYPYLLLFTNDANGSARQWFFQGDKNGDDQMYVWSDPDVAWKKPLGFRTGGTNTADAGWHHYALTYGGGVLRPYVDGLAKTPQNIAGSPNFPTFNHLLIGGKNQNFTSWEGPIDDVGIFNDTQSHQRIALINGLGQPSFGVALDDPAIDSVLAVFNSQFGSAMAGGVTWEFATGLPESIVGEIGGSLATNDAYIVLGSNVNGGIGVQMVLDAPAVPEPSTLVLLSLGLLGFAAAAAGRLRRA